MPSNALDTMVVPVIRGLFLTAILGGAAVGLARMVGAIASCLRPAGGEPPGAAEGPRQSAAEASQTSAPDGLATVGAG